MVNLAPPTAHDQNLIREINSDQSLAFQVCPSQLPTYLPPPSIPIPLLRVCLVPPTPYSSPLFPSFPPSSPLATASRLPAPNCSVGGGLDCGRGGSGAGQPWLEWVPCGQSGDCWAAGTDRRKRLRCGVVGKYPSCRELAPIHNHPLPGDWLMITDINL